jgi:hypothetical protein
LIRGAWVTESRLGPTTRAGGVTVDQNGQFGNNAPGPVPPVEVRVGVGVPVGGFVDVLVGVGDAVVGDCEGVVGVADGVVGVGVEPPATGSATSSA